MPGKCHEEGRRQLPRSEERLAEYRESTTILITYLLPNNSGLIDHLSLGKWPIEDSSTQRNSASTPQEFPAAGQWYNTAGGGRIGCLTTPASDLQMVQPLLFSRLICLYTLFPFAELFPKAASGFPSQWSLKAVRFLH